MQKTDFISTIQKYYLAGKCKDVCWEISDKNLYVDFLTDDGAMLGTLSAVTDLPDNVIAVFNTDKLLSMLSPLGDEVQGQYKKYKDKTVGIQFSDNSVDVYFTTGDLANVPDPKQKLQAFRDRGRQLKTQPIPAYEVKLDKESISRFLKAKKALSDAKTVTLIQGVDSVEFVVNYSQNRNENKITVPFPAVIEKETALFTYNVELLALVLSTNDSFREGKIVVTENGLMVMSFAAEDYTVTYYLNALEV